MSVHPAIPDESAGDPGKCRSPKKRNRCERVQVRAESFAQLSTASSISLLTTPVECQETRTSPNRKGGRRESTRPRPIKALTKSLGDPSRERVNGEFALNEICLSESDVHRTWVGSYMLQATALRNVPPSNIICLRVIISLHTIHASVRRKCRSTQISHFTNPTTAIRT